MNQSDYPYYDQYEQFFNETFKCYYCKKLIKRGPSIGRCGFRCKKCLEEDKCDSTHKSRICTHSDDDNQSKSGCSYHPGIMEPYDGKRIYYYMTCCKNPSNSDGCKSCDHNSKHHLEEYLDAPAFIVENGWIKPLKNNNMGRTDVFLEEKGEKKPDKFGTIYKIKRFDI